MEASEYALNEQLEATHWWFVGRRAVIRSVLARHLPRAQGLTVLDVGAGTGGMLPMLSELGDVTAVEESADAIERAKRRFSHFRVLQGALPDGLPDGKFDLITAFDVLEHLDAPVEAVRSIGSRLSPAGHFVCTVPANPALWSEHDDLNHHRRRYTREELVSHLEQGGLRVRWVSYFNTLLYPAVAVARRVQRVLGLKSGKSDLKPTGAPINAMLTRLFSSEAALVGRASLPFGVSLIAVASRPDEA